MSVLISSYSTANIGIVHLEEAICTALYHRSANKVPGPATSKVIRDYLGLWDDKAHLLIVDGVLQRLCDNDVVVKHEFSIGDKPVESWNLTDDYKGYLGNLDDNGK